MREVANIEAVEGEFEGILFDAFGVLVDESGWIPGAIDMLCGMNERGKRFWVLTNGSSTLEKDWLARWNTQDLRLTADQVISSGGLLRKYFKQSGFVGNKVAVLGTDGSKRYVEESGGYVLDWQDWEQADLIVIANQTGFPLNEGIDRAINICCRAIVDKRAYHVINTNPDLIYPQGSGDFGITAGSLAMLVEEAVILRFGEQQRKNFIRLGKPFAPIFDEAVYRANSESLLMVGDQLVTDIKGARDYGIASMLVSGGLTNFDYLNQIMSRQLQPDFICRTWLKSESA